MRDKWTARCAVTFLCGALLVPGFSAAATRCGIDWGPPQKVDSVSTIVLDGLLYSPIVLSGESIEIISPPGLKEQRETRRAKVSIWRKHGAKWARLETLELQGALRWLDAVREKGAIRVLFEETSEGGRRYATAVMRDGCWQAAETVVDENEHQFSTFPFIAAVSRYKGTSYLYFPTYTIRSSLWSVFLGGRHVRRVMEVNLSNGQVQSLPVSNRKQTVHRFAVFGNHDRRWIVWAESKARRELARGTGEGYKFFLGTWDGETWVGLTRIDAGKASPPSRGWTGQVHGVMGKSGEVVVVWNVDIGGMSYVNIVRVASGRIDRKLRYRSGSHALVTGGKRPWLIFQGGDRYPAGLLRTSPEETRAATRGWLPAQQLYVVSVEDALNDVDPCLVAPETVSLSMDAEADSEGVVHLTYSEVTDEGTTELIYRTGVAESGETSNEHERCGEYGVGAGR